MELKMSLLRFVAFLVLVVALTTYAEPTLANFTCGPHMKTYSVATLGGRPGRGVRCLFFPGGRFDREFVWYGEGYWGRFIWLSYYRHVGENRGGDLGSAANFYGNGESTDEVFYSTLEMAFSNRDRNTPPNRIEVRGPWNEAWTLESDDIHQGYTHSSNLRRVEVCGKNFLQFEAIDRPTSTRSKDGFGVRCFLNRQAGIEPGFLMGMWYGEGQWNGTYYAHLGSHTSRLLQQLTAADICDPSLSGFCGKVGAGKLKHTYFGAVLTPKIPARWIKVEGDWREDWVLNDINPCCSTSPPSPPVVAPSTVR